MGRILTPVLATNPLDPTRSIRFDALVDTGSSFLVLPMAWKERLSLATRSDVERLERRLDARLAEIEAKLGGGDAAKSSPGTFLP